MHLRHRRRLHRDQVGQGHRWPSRQESQRDLARRRAVRVGDLLEQRALAAAGGREIVVAERRIGHHRNTMRLAPRDHRVLDGALLQMIQHLIAGDFAGACDVEHLLEIARVKIADAP